MEFLFFSFALKNVFRNKWRTMFIIILLILGILAMTVSVAIGEFSENFVDSVFNQSLNGTDNYSLYSSGFNFSNSSDSAMDSSDSAMENFNEDDNNYSKFNNYLVYSNFSYSNLSYSNLSNETGMGSIEEMKKKMTDTIKTFLFYIDIFLIVLGAIIILIAMLKAVGERTREIGVLKSIGWSNIRVLGLILSESIFQLLISWIIALILISITLLYFKSLNSEIIKTLAMNVSIFRILGITFLLSLFVPIIGSLMPLLKVFKIKPSESLRYE